MRHGHFDSSADEQVSWATLKQLIPYLLEFKGRIFLAMLCLVAAKVASVGMPFILKNVVDGLDLESGTQQMIAVPIALIIAYGSLRLANVLFGELRDTLFGRVTERAMRRIGLTVFNHLHSLDLDFHLSRRTGGLSRDIERGVSGVSFLLRFMVFNIVPIVLEVSMVLGIFLFKYDPWFAVIIASSIVAYVGWTVKATEWRTRYVREANEADSKSNTAAVDSLLNYETVKYFNNEQYEANRYDKDLASWETARRKNRLSLFALNGGQALVVGVAMTLMLLLTGFHIIDGSMSIGEFVMVNAFMMQIFMPLNFLGFVYREMKGSMANIEKMFSLLRQAPKITDAKDAKPITVTKGEIKFNRVSFHYKSNRPILKNISLTIKPGQKVAFVGSSGAGKSTLMKLLYRFYDPTEGTIEIDGAPIDQVTQQSLRQHIGIVPQDTVLFNSTIGDNIRYGNVKATEQDIQNAIQHAYLQDFIDQLPDGVDTLVGERGLKLSGGEKQRVAIARTILKKPPILLFDEATSSLDSHSEQYILKAINEVSKNHTSVMIAHRLSTIVDADVIFVLHQGEIVEQGNHQQLLDKDEHYANLWLVQQKQRQHSKIPDKA
ncbi:ABCB family ABC transporter ATP-binding protein/permease [Pleionea mediterranea]|uniref:ATP-binding cassette subfamily B protein n=1 Tax=Pleionea mediterranea TaxID=523701 RepID=A0A316G1L9_9GAMM|nr:ABC transporter ATP-binding protein/permease [Pleionea mediterranea]PWK53796.1 ATP-binding cassette subfamily B protein [Pleionea mediterranea]